VLTRWQSNIIIDENGSPRINLISFEHFVMLTHIPAPSPSYSNNWPIVSRWWSPDIYKDILEFAAVENDIWAFGCVALEVHPSLFYRLSLAVLPYFLNIKVLTGEVPYAGIESTESLLST
jgi:serine/threonine protein kinase